MSVILTTLLSVIEALSPWTWSHSERVARYAHCVGLEMKLSRKERDLLRIGGLLHDIGKLGIQESLLNKTDNLSPEEYELIKSHPIRGVEILRSIRRMEPILPCIAYHHENYDGSGYPSGASGKTIPRSARILRVVDAYDSMVNLRPYQQYPNSEYALSELRRCSGTHFDPEMVRVFTEVLAASRINRHGR